jgi:hypothetical protein
MEPICREDSHALATHRAGLLRARPAELLDHCDAHPSDFFPLGGSVKLRSRFPLFAFPWNKFIVREDEPGILTDFRYSRMRHRDRFGVPTESNTEVQHRVMCT